MDEEVKQLWKNVLVNSTIDIAVKVAVFWAIKKYLEKQVAKDQRNKK